MQRSFNPHDDLRLALGAFLDEHLGRVEGDEVGPWIGQAAWIDERGAAVVDDRDEAQRALNAALAH